MSDLTIELCPETGICSILKSDGRADLMPAEVDDIRDAAGDLQQVRQVVSQVDTSFAADLDEAELKQVAQRLAP